MVSLYASCKWKEKRRKTKSDQIKIKFIKLSFQSVEHSIRGFVFISFRFKLEFKMVFYFDFQPFNGDRMCFWLYEPKFVFSFCKLFNR